MAVKAQMLAPEVVFKEISKYSYGNIDPNKWYPMDQFTMLTDYIEKTHSPLVLSKIGKAIIPAMKDAKIIPDMPPEDFLRSLPHVYSEGNKGPNIGNWYVIKDEPKHFILENKTLHNCQVEEGILIGGIKAFGGLFAKIDQTKCVRNGDPFCVFEITWM